MMMSSYLEHAAGWLLQCMRDVGGDWAGSVAHEHKVARVDDQVAVPKCCPPLAHQHVGVACHRTSCLRGSQEILHRYIILKGDHAVAGNPSGGVQLGGYSSSRKSNSQVVDCRTLSMAPVWRAQGVGQQHLRPCANQTCTPAQRALSAELRITEGAQNCPFLMWMTRPVRAAATMRSVCRHRKAGIWMMSATSAIASACDASWMSVMIGSPSVSFTTFNTLPRQSRSA